MGATQITRRGVMAKPGAFDPLSLSPTHWYKMHALGLSDGASVTNLPDSSGNGRDILSSDILGINFKLAIINGLSVVRGNAVNSLAQMSVPKTMARASTWFIVAKYNAAYSAKASICSYSGSAAWAFSRTSSTNMQMNGVNASTTPESPHVYSADFGAGDLYVDGSLKGSGAGISGIDPAPRFWRDANNISVAPVDIGEVLIYAGSLSGVNRALVEGYLKGKWGTP